jgi:hypothetical protein
LTSSRSELSIRQTQKIEQLLFAVGASVRIRNADGHADGTPPPDILDVVRAAELASFIGRRHIMDPR